jgi:alcohol dehydrogenase
VGGAPDTVVIGLGGGSAMDAAKGVALLATNPGPVRSLDYRNPLANPALPLVAVPTTAGTGAETNAFGVITDHELGNKLYVGNGTAMPRLALLDPALTVGVPPVPTANTGMDALTHAVEAMSSRNRNEYADGLALQVAHMVRTWLPRAVADGGDLEARSHLLLAAHLAGGAMATGTGQGAAHGIGHALSTRLGVAHGAGLAVVLPHVMRFNLGLRAGAYARLALALGAGRPGEPDERGAAAAIDALEALSAEVGTARRLADFGLVDDDQARQIAEDCLADSVTDNAPRYPTIDEALALVDAAR